MHRWVITFILKATSNSEGRDWRHQSKVLGSRLIPAARIKTCKKPEHHYTVNSIGNRSMAIFVIWQDIIIWPRWSHSPLHVIRDQDNLGSKSILFCALSRREKPAGPLKAVPSTASPIVALMELHLQTIIIHHSNPILFFQLNTTLCSLKPQRGENTPSNNPEWWILLPLHKALLTKHTFWLFECPNDNRRTGLESNYTAPVANSWCLMFFTFLLIKSSQLQGEKNRGKENPHNISKFTPGIKSLFQMMFSQHQFFMHCA
jgi:hypothetical protein